MSLMVLMPMALGAARRSPSCEGVCWCENCRRDCDALECLERFELLLWECVCEGVGAAVQGRWRGECGEACTGRKNCESERGLAMGEARGRVGGVGRRGLEEAVWVVWWGAGGLRGFSKSEQ